MRRGQGKAQALLPVEIPNDETPLAPVKLNVTDLADLQALTDRAAIDMPLSAPALAVLEVFERDRLAESVPAPDFVVELAAPALVFLAVVIVVRTAASMLGKWQIAALTASGSG